MLTTALGAKWSIANNSSVSAITTARIYRGGNSMNTRRTTSYNLASVSMKAVVALTLVISYTEALIGSARRITYSLLTS